MMLYQLPNPICCVSKDSNFVATFLICPRSTGGCAVEGIFDKAVLDFVSDDLLVVS